MTSRSAESSEVNAVGATTAALEADVINRGAVKALVAQIVERLDPFDVLVDGAAIEESPPLETGPARA